MDSISLEFGVAYISISLNWIIEVLLEICLQRGWCEVPLFMLEYNKVVDH